MSLRRDPDAIALAGFDRQVPLSEHCTLQVGGPARFFARCAGEKEVLGALEWARHQEQQVFVLGGGSNVLFADAGWSGLVLHQEDARIELEDSGEQHLMLKAAAGAEWDRVVRVAIEAGLGGVECLAGIPGRAGAAPIQNIGAYGQEVSETVHRVRVIERENGEIRELSAQECGFTYRYSHFKGEWRDRFIVTGLTLRLPKTKVGTVRYGELQRRLEAGETPPTPATVRRTVLELRRSKSMVLDPEDPNRRSAGSFFLNPVVSARAADRVEELAAARGVSRRLPRFPATGGVKLPAAWLIEEAGYSRGFGNGPVGLSSQHCLALVNRGGANAAQLLDLASQVRSGVFAAFGVYLEPEPVFVGFERSIEQLFA